VCPLVIRNDCVKWLREVTDAMPTVVLSATGSDGGDRPDAQVSMDGQVIETHLDGRPLSVDPGPHVFRFELPDLGAVEQRVLVREGQKDRAIVGAFPRTVAPTAVSAPAPPSATTPPQETTAPDASTTSTQRYARPVPVSVWVLGSVGVASLLVSGTFASLGWFGSPGWFPSQSCKPNCPPGDVNTMKTHFEIADVAGGFAILSLGIGAYFYFTRPASSSAAPVGLTLGPHAAVMSYSATF
jgi:hypothetical protein